MEVPTGSTVNLLGAVFGKLDHSAGQYHDDGKTYALRLSDADKDPTLTLGDVDILTAGVSYSAAYYTNNTCYIGTFINEGDTPDFEPLTWYNIASAVSIGKKRSSSTNVGTIVYPNDTTETTDEEETTTTDEVEIGFVDVDKDDYFYEAVEWTVGNGITTGMTNTAFEPETFCTRAQAVTFLWRAMSEPVTEAENIFADVDQDGYYGSAVKWALEQGITNGMGNDLFGIDNSCTRAQIITFLWRATGSPEVDGSHDFTDVEAGSYYEMALLWAVENGITNGMGDGTFGVNEPCTRAQIVTFLYHFFVSVKCVPVLR